MGVDMTIATCLHRLDQLTRPIFDRATVEELLGEIMRLRSAEHRNKIATELAWRDTRIDELEGEKEDLEDEVEELQRRVEMLLDANTALAKQLDAKAIGQLPNRVTTGHSAALPNPTEIRRVIGALEEPQASMFPPPRHPSVQEIGRVLNGPPPVSSLDEARGRIAAIEPNRVLPMRPMELTDEGLAVYRKDEGRDRLGSFVRQPAGRKASE